MRKKKKDQVEGIYFLLPSTGMLYASKYGILSIYEINLKNKKIGNGEFTQAYN